MSNAPVVAVDIGGTKIACGLVELYNGQPVVTHVHKRPTQAQKGGEQVLAAVLDAIKTAVSLAEIPPVGVGVSSAGVVDPRTGDITYANELMPGWGGTRLGFEIQQATGLPCRVMNDVHAHALGEARHGGGRDATSCLVVAVGTGIGGAFIEQGHLMLGAHDEAGHIGHVCCPAAVGISCPCGGTAHLEPIASGPGIIREYIRLGGVSVGADGLPIEGAEINALALAGDQIACAAQARAGRALGEVLGSMCNMLDPSCIILSGSVVQCGASWSDALHEGFESQAMPPVQQTPIWTGELGEHAPLIGAAENFITPGYHHIEA